MTVNKKLFAIVALLLATVSFTASAATKTYQLTSPDGKTSVVVNNDGALTYSVSRAGILLLAPSPIGMEISGGKEFGAGDKVKKVEKRSVDQILHPVIYKRSEVRDNFNEIKLVFQDYDVIFRAYDDGVAYRFVSRLKGDYTVNKEEAVFSFAGDWNAYIPYVSHPTLPLETQFYSSFENTYAHIPLSGWNKERLAFLPLTVEAPAGMKICVTESDLLDYPGMYLYGEGTSQLKGVFAPYPKDVKQGGHNMLQGEVQTREDFIAKASGTTAFPWRTLIISDEDRQLSVNDMVWKLATPSNGDFSWVRPGKVAWDWWNDWNIYGVDFRAGINNDTYKYYIDFASKQGIEYVILDEGWAVNLQADLMQVIPEINLEELAAYAQSKGVGLILWAGYWAFNRDMEGVCSHYSKMGIKGFKIDFMDRDDQQMLQFYVNAAKMAAKYHMMCDFHGAFKPAGLQRTYPNVVNFEGVHGLENMKWESGVDQVTYDLTIPFTRMVAGPMDYTQGAMKNANRGNYRPVNSEPMSQGTRCRQLAEYVIFESPLNMLCDSPSNYMAEPECTKFIAEIPTTWDESMAVDAKIAEYVVTARRKGNTWYVGAMTDWNARDMELDLSFLGSGQWKMEVFKDGPNADRAARDFMKAEENLPADGKVKIHMAPGGGWAAKITRR